MLTLVTTNPAKYDPFAGELQRLRIQLEAPRQSLLELQTVNFDEAVAEKARSMAAAYGRPVLVDDAGLDLEAYSPFPGPLTSVVLRRLGTAGLKRLLDGVSNRAAIECHIGCWINGELRSWCGRQEGHLDFSRKVRHPRLPLTDLFVPDSLTREPLPHRARALRELEASAFELHLDTAPEPSADDTLICPHSPEPQCPFCAELQGQEQTIFSNMVGDRLKSRILYQDEHFVVMPPLGQIIEGGLLLLSGSHILSFAHLPTEHFERLEQLIESIGRSLQQKWGVHPLFFEHGPAPERSKGLCCVDHAHFNIFPARVRVQPHLSRRMSFPVHSLAELPRLRRAEFGYLFVQENDGTRRVYDGECVPTQLVRRIISSEIGLPDRWHWRDYPGVDQLVRTYHSLKGQIRV
jgi:diadenosine tetraphosphate (Ap4A) HIT family hydrolase